MHCARPLYDAALRICFVDERQAPCGAGHADHLSHGQQLCPPTPGDPPTTCPAAILQSRDHDPSECPDVCTSTMIVAHQQKRRGSRARASKNWAEARQPKAFQVAILSEPLGPLLSTGRRQVGEDPLDRRFGSARRGDGLLFSTIRGFKGLEADAVVMLDVPRPDSVPFFSRADFYVGASRAKHLLAILAEEDGIIRNP